MTPDGRESDRATVQRRMMDLAEELYPLPRSITGEGVRKTLQILQRFIPLEIHEVATGTQVLDWTVPREWTIRDAYIKDATGRRIVDFHASNLHVVGYSVPVHATMSLAELRPHLHSLPDRPSWIPYRTSYYNETWGFCLSHQQLIGLDEGPFEVCIDADLRDGHLTYGELVLPWRRRATRSSSRPTSVTLRLRTTISRGSPLRRSWPQSCSTHLDGTRCGSCSRPARSARSPG